MVGEILALDRRVAESDVSSVPPLVVVGEAALMLLGVLPSSHLTERVELVEPPVEVKWRMAGMKMRDVTESYAHGIPSGWRGRIVDVPLPSAILDVKMPSAEDVMIAMLVTGSIEDKDLARRALRGRGDVATRTARLLANPIELALRISGEVEGDRTPAAKASADSRGPMPLAPYLRGLAARLAGTNSNGKSTEGLVADILAGARTNDRPYAPLVLWCQCVGRTGYLLGLPDMACVREEARAALDIIGAKPMDELDDDELDGLVRRLPREYGKHLKTYLVKKNWDRTLREDDLKDVSDVRRLWEFGVVDESSLALEAGCSEDLARSVIRDEGDRTLEMLAKEGLTAHGLFVAARRVCERRMRKQGL